MSLLIRNRWRYSISGLLTLTALVAISCFWVTWPQRAAEQFVVDYFCDLDLDVNANPFRRETPEAAAWEKHYDPPKRNMTLSSHKRSLYDVILGRQTFDCETYEFTICRGNVVRGPTPFFESGVRFYR